MVRILQYDPRITAAAYSQRRVAEEGFDSGVATGLARLGRALGGREEGFRRAGAGAMAAREAIGFWDDEVARLDELGAKIPPGKTGFHDLAMKEHLARRTETIARLKETDPEQAALFDLRTRPLVETLERRASAMEADAAGQTLSAGMGGALVMAAKTVRADPLQHDAIRDGLVETLSEMERDGVDAEALARVRASADRSLAMAAIGGLIDDGQFDAARELLAEDRMPALTPGDRREQERRVGRAERRAEATGSAELAAARDNYWAGYRSLEARLREGGEVPDLRYTDDSIRAALPQAQAEKMIALRDEAEDAGDAHARIALASPETVRAMIREAGPDEARHLRAAARERERRLAEDPAAFVLGNGRVRAARDAWQAALAGDDPDAIAGTARAYAQASLDEQRRLGVPDADRRVLPAESAAAMVTAFTAAERPDPAALGAEMRARFGEHWRPVLEDLKAAGLPEGMAAIAAMDRPDQQAAAERLSVLAGISTAELKDRIGDEAAGAVDAELQLPGGALHGTAAGPNGTAIDAEAELARRLAYHDVGMGEAPKEAARNAAKRTTKRTTKRPDREDGTGEDRTPSAWLEPAFGAEGQRNIVTLFDNILSATPAEAETLERRILDTFDDAPGYAALVTRLMRAVALGEPPPDMPLEEAPRLLRTERDRIAAGGDYDHDRAARRDTFAAFESETPYRAAPAEGDRIAFSAVGDAAPFLTLPVGVAQRLARDHADHAEVLAFMAAWRSGDLTGDALRAEAARLFVRGPDGRPVEDLGTPAEMELPTGFMTLRAGSEHLIDRSGLDAVLAADEMLSRGEDSDAVMAALIPALMPELFEDDSHEWVLELVLDVLPVIGNIRSAVDAVDDFQALTAAVERGDWRGAAAAGLFTALDVAGVFPGTGILLRPMIRQARRAARRVPGLRVVEARVQVRQWRRNIPGQFDGTPVEDFFGIAWHRFTRDQQVSLRRLQPHIIGNAGENFAADTLERGAARVVRTPSGVRIDLPLRIPQPKLTDAATGRTAGRVADITLNEEGLDRMMQWLFGFGRVGSETGTLEVKVGSAILSDSQRFYDDLAREQGDLMHVLSFPLEDVPPEYLVAETRRLFGPWVGGRRRIRFSQAEVESLVDVLRGRRHPNGRPASIFDWMMTLALIEASERGLEASVQDRA